MNNSAPEIDKESRHGHWTKEEHARFLQSISLYGKDWKKVVEHVGTRSSNQVRSHAQKYFLKLERKSKNSFTQAKDYDQEYLARLQAFSFSTCMKFIHEMHKAFMMRNPSVAEPVRIVTDEEGNEEDQTKKRIKIS